jgi:hypothetical protein
MTPDDFRQIALSMPEAVESSHMGHPDFRVRNTVFATLSYPDEGWGMVKLTPDQQRLSLATHPATFVPAKGAWGLKGSTLVRLSAANEVAVHEAMESAWRAVAEKTPGRKKRAR